MGNIPASDFKVDAIIQVPINGDLNNLASFKILKIGQTSSGFTGAIIQDLSSGKIGVWADGSKGLNNLRLDGSFFHVFSELCKDWVMNDFLGIGGGQIDQQLKDLRAFIDEYGANNIDFGIGQSMAGINMSALAYTQGYENIAFRTYGGPLPDYLRNTISNTSGWGINSLDGANLFSTYTPKEPLLNWVKPYIGHSTVYIKESTTATGWTAHSAAAYLNVVDPKNPIFEDNVYYKLKDFNYSPIAHPIWALNPLSTITICETGDALKIKLAVDSLETANAVASYCSYVGGLNDETETLQIQVPTGIGEGTETYNVKSLEGLKRRGIDVTKIISDNYGYDIQSRIVDGGNAALFKEGEKILIPKDCVKPVDYSQIVSDIKLLLMVETSRHLTWTYHKGFMCPAGLRLPLRIFITNIQLNLTMVVY